MALCGQLHPLHGDAGAGIDARQGGMAVVRVLRGWGRGRLDWKDYERFKLWMFMDDIY